MTRNSTAKNLSSSGSPGTFPKQEFYKGSEPSSTLASVERTQAYSLLIMLGANLLIMIIGCILRLRSLSPDQGLGKAFMLPRVATLVTNVRG